MIDTPIRIFFAKLCFLLILVSTMILPLFVFFPIILVLAGGISFAEDVLYKREKGDIVLVLFILSLTIGGKLGVTLIGIPLWEKLMVKTRLISKKKIRELLDS